MDLPMEVQLEVLLQCLVSQRPIVDFGRRYTTRGKRECRRHGQDETNFRMLATCRRYHEEGWRIFWSRNTFVYTWIAPLAANLSYPFCSPSSPTPPLKTLSLTYYLRLDDDTVASVLDYVLATWRSVSELPHLKHLSVRFNTTKYPPRSPYVLSASGQLQPRTNWYYSQPRDLVSQAQSCYQQHVTASRRNAQNSTQSTHPQLQSLFMEGFGLEVRQVILLAVKLLGGLVVYSGEINLWVGIPELVTPAKGPAGFLDAVITDGTTTEDICVKGKNLNDWLRTRIARTPDSAQFQWQDFGIEQ